MGPVVTVCGAANLGISFMAVSSPTNPTGERADQWRSAVATSLRRHDPDQVQRVRLLAVSAPFRTPLEHTECGPGGRDCQLPGRDLPDLGSTALAARRHGWAAARALARGEASRERGKAGDTS